MTTSQLRDQFGIANVLTFDEDHGLTRLHVSIAGTQATMYLQGAHLTDWKPKGQERVIFLSRLSELAPGKPIRGGVPIVFPWFATDSKPDRIDGHPGPSHGFARVQDWTLRSATQQQGCLHLQFTLGPTGMSRSMGFDQFLLTLDAVIGPTLDLQLTVANNGTALLTFEEAFHAYFSVVDVHEAEVTGLESAAYLDKTDELKLHPATGIPVTFTGPVDRIYLDTTGPCTIRDGAQSRIIQIRKMNSHSTVVWNPWKALPDLGPWDWHEMLCVETTNVGSASQTLAPGGTHNMALHVSLERRAHAAG